MAVEPDAPEVVIWSRGQNRAWTRGVVEAMDGEVDMPSIGATLPLAEIYADVVFPIRHWLAGIYKSNNARGDRPRFTPA